MSCFINFATQRSLQYTVLLGKAAISGSEVLLAACTRDLTGTFTTYIVFHM